MVDTAASAESFGNAVDFEDLDAVAGILRSPGMKRERDEREILIREDFEGLLIVEGLGKPSPGIGEKNSTRQSGIGGI
jgi:hypothetical protein